MLLQKEGRVVEVVALQGCSSCSRRLCPCLWLSGQGGGWKELPPSLPPLSLIHLLTHSEVLSHDVSTVRLVRGRGGLLAAQDALAVQTKGQWLSDMLFSMIISVYILIMHLDLSSVFPKSPWQQDLGHGHARPVHPPPAPLAAAGVP